MADSSGDAFPAGGIRRGHLFFRTTDGLLYLFLGGNPTVETNWRVSGGAIAGDPNTAGWGTNQKGAFWFNTTIDGFRGWNGDAIVFLG